MDATVMAMIAEAVQGQEFVLIRSANTAKEMMGVVAVEFRTERNHRPACIKKED